MSKRAAIYARVSTDMQRDNYSVPTQIDECKKYAETKGYPIVGDKYVDTKTGRDSAPGNGAIKAYVDDLSSRELSRPSLDAGINFLEEAGFDVLIVHSLDRLARDPYIRETIERELLSRGVKVEYVLGNYEDSPDGEVRKDLEATFAKWENLKRVERSNRGKIRKAENGKFVSGRCPYGYRYDKSSISGLSICENEADIVREIFRLYIDGGLSIRQITKTLNNGNIPTKLGGDKWGKSTIPKILRNSTYVGHCYYNKHKREGNKLVIRDKEEWIKIETPRIIDDWSFDEAQHKLKENKLIRRRQPNRFYLLSGMVFCSECGRPYVAQTAKAGKNRRINDSQSYRHRAKEGHCTNRMISARKIEPLVWETIVNILLQPDRLKKGYEASLDQYKKDHAKGIRHLQTLRKSLIKCKEKRKNLNTLYIDPEIKISRSEYIEQKTVLDSELKQITNDIEEAEKRVPYIPLPSEFKNFEIFAAKIVKRLSTSQPIKSEDKREIFELLNLKVRVGLDSSVTLEGWFDGDSECLSSITPS